MTRKPLLIGNWKMFKTSQEANEFINELRRQLATSFQDDREVTLGVPFPSLEAAAQAAVGSPITIAAQNLHWEAEGAFTGEVSGPMLTAAGARAVIIGHSERRQLFGDTNEWINKKLSAALKYSLTPILCLGETWEDRKTGRAFELLGRQLAEALSGLTTPTLVPLVIAYEPVWAIGTGQTATPKTAQETHAFIRQWLTAHYDHSFANAVRLLYGGSVKPDNVAQLMDQTDIDGALVGGASLKPDSFARIINFDR
ncbi:MAG: triose-phosphate isomerase [Candidatus Adiutrix intracellularis]|jgi:triosephosphate isomerase|nr:MAG: triose-phosphate isomerase [Candidatus Adiutrix intracellularis]MDR2827481.1 triose-phosphate isomerase [Candidatus Adiutrix intracellularis]